MPNDSMCRRYHAVVAANLQCVLAQCKYKIISYENLIYANIVNITNILRYENLSLYNIFDQLIGLFDSLQQWAILRAKDCNLSSWLSVMPLESDHFDLFPQEFRDAIALHYRKPLLDLPFFVMDVVLPLLLSMLYIVALEAWLDTVIMK